MFNFKQKALGCCIAIFTVLSVYSQSKTSSKILENFKIPKKNFVQSGTFNHGFSGWHFFRKHGGKIVNEGRNGEACFKISGSFDDYIYLDNCGLRRGWGINLKQGRTYTLSVWFKTKNVKKLMHNNVLFIVNYGWTKAVGLGAGTATTDGWVKKTLTFIAPKQTRIHDGIGSDYRFLIFWPKGANGTMWIDDIQIEEGAKATEFSDFWNFQAIEICHNIQETYAKILKAETVLKKRFPKALGMHIKFKKHLNRLEQLAAKLNNPAHVTNATCFNGEKIIKDISKQAAKIMFPIWFKNPYRMSFQHDFPSNFVAPEIQKFSCYINQRRNIGLMLTNLSGEHIDARVAPQIFLNKQNQQKINGNNFITVYNAPLLAGRLLKDKKFTDPLPKANAINWLTIPAGTTRQTIISFSTEGLLPGTYKGSILVDSLTDKTFTRNIPIELEVRAVRLPSQVPVDVGALGIGLLRKEEANRLGHNVLMLDLFGFPPGVDRTGNLLPVDYARLDIAIKEARQVSPNCKFMLIWSVGCKFINSANRYGMKWPDTRLEKAWQTWIKNLFIHLKEQGVKPKDFLLQVVDEPGPAAAANAGELQRSAKAVVPELQTTSCLTSFKPNDKNKQFYDSLDYAVPLVRVARNGKCASYFKSRKSNTAIYDCAQGTETLNPITYYRLMPWRVWQQNLAGWYYWYREDRSPNWSCMKYMSTVYPDRDGNAQYTNNPIWPEDKYIISRRWLAMEAGYQDYKALYLLKKVLENVTKKADVDKKLIKKAKDFLKNAPARALALDDAKKYPRAMADKADPDILEQMDETMLKLTADLLKYDKLKLVEKPAIDKNGILSFKTNKPTTGKINYLIDGKLPWLTISISESSDIHRISIPKTNEQNISKCNILLVDDLGKAMVISPFIKFKVNTDSVFRGYGLECLIDGERVPAAQFWMGKTWLSNASSSSHWVALSWKEVKQIKQINICWMSRGGLPTAYKIQSRKNGKWIDITKGWNNAKSAFEIITFSPIKTKAIRVIQKASGGNPAMPKLMGISELEVF